MSDHLTPEAIYDYSDQGGGSGPAGHHLMGCPQYLFVLDLILLCEAPATPEEDTVLRSLPRWIQTRAS